MQEREREKARLKKEAQERERIARDEEKAKQRAAKQAKGDPVKRY